MDKWKKSEQRTEDLRDTLVVLLKDAKRDAPDFKKFIKENTTIARADPRTGCLP